MERRDTGDDADPEWGEVKARGASPNPVVGSRLLEAEAFLGTSDCISTEVVYADEGGSDHASPDGPHSGSKPFLWLGFDASQGYQPADP
jgi:hypothetical protein